MGHSSLNLSEYILHFYSDLSENEVTYQKPYYLSVAVGWVQRQRNPTNPPKPLSISDELPLVGIVFY